MAYNYTVKKGDTLNTIAQAHGFANYKDAGVASVPSGNFDLIKEGETVTLGNYNPNEVKPFATTPQVLSSKDNQQQYVKDNEKLNGITSAFDASILGKNTKTTETKTPTTETKSDTSTTGDPLFDSLDKANKEYAVKAEQERIAKKAEYESLYQTSLANLDASAKSAIDRINSSYDKRIREQERINRLNVDRTKAYGLSSGGQYTPIDFGDAISGREQEASDKISALESERTNLINQAKQARDEGASKLLREKLNDLTKVDDEIRKNLNEVEAESEKRYKLLREIRVDEEKKAKERQVKALKQVSDLAPSFADKYTVMTPEQKDKFIKEITTQTGLDYASVYASIESAIVNKKKTDLDLQQKEATVKKTWRQNTTTPKSTTPTSFKGTIPDTFASMDDYLAKRAQFVKDNGTKGASYWDSIFPKDPITKDPQFKTEKKTSSPQTSKKDPLGLGI